jgi:hypothetical protein
VGHPAGEGGPESLGACGGAGEVTHLTCKDVERGHLAGTGRPGGLGACSKVQVQMCAGLRRTVVVLVRGGDMPGVCLGHGKPVSA